MSVIEADRLVREFPVGRRLRGERRTLRAVDDVSFTIHPGEVVQDEFRGQDILIGTYSFNGNRLAMFIRKINSTSGVISKMVSKEVVYNCGFMGTMAKIIK